MWYFNYFKLNKNLTYTMVKNTKYKLVKWVFVEHIKV